MSEVGELDVDQVQQGVIIAPSEEVTDGREETVVKIKLVEESISVQVPVEERSPEVDLDEEERERKIKDVARKEKRKQRREKRRERKKSKGSTSDENDINQDDASQEKKGNETSGMEEGTREAGISVVRSERHERTAGEMRALLDTILNGETFDTPDRDPEAEERANEEREKRAEEVLAAMDFSSEHVRPEPPSDDAPAGESVADEFFAAQQVVKKDVHLEMMLPSDDCDAEMTQEPGTATFVSEEDKDANLERLFAFHGTDNSDGNKSEAVQGGNPVEEIIVSLQHRENHTQPQVWQLADGGDEPREGRVEPAALSEEEKDKKLSELFEKVVPADNDAAKEGKSLESRAPPVEETEVTADCHTEVETGVDLSLLDDSKCTTLPQDEFNNATQTGEEKSNFDIAKGESTEEVGQAARVQESVHECVSVPDRTFDLCLEALCPGDVMPGGDDAAPDAGGPAKQQPPEDLDSLFTFRSELEQKDMSVEQTAALGEGVSEEEIVEEKKRLNVECIWDLSSFDEPGEKEKAADTEDGARIVDETPENVTKTTEKFTESTTTYTTSIVIKPASPTTKEPASPTQETASRSTVTTTLETIMVTKTPDPKTGEPQVVLRRDLKKEVGDAFEPLPDKESDGTAPLAQVEGTGLEDSEDDLLKGTNGNASSREKEPLTEVVGAGGEPDAEAKKPEAQDEEEAIPGRKKKGKRHRKQCCVMQ